MRDDDRAQHRPAVAAEIVGRLDQRVVEALEARIQRDHHEQQRGVDKTDEDGRVAVEHLDRRVGDAERHEDARQHAGLAQQDHPAERAHGLADPERDQADREQQGAHPALRELGDGPGDGEGDQQGDRGRDQRDDRRAHKDIPVERLGEEGPVLGEAIGVFAGTGTFAEGEQREVKVRQQDEPQKPYQCWGEQQPEQEAPRQSAAGLNHVRRSQSRQRDRGRN